jgi:hypothetical protein
MEKAAAKGGHAPSPQHRPTIACRHTPATRFRRGEPLDIALSFPHKDKSGVELFYRHVDQAEAWQHAAMQFRDDAWRAAISADYTQTTYPLQYYFVVSQPAGKNIYPGFNPNLTGLPYFVVRSS